MFESHTNCHAVPDGKDAALHVRHGCLTLQSATQNSITQKSNQMELPAAADLLKLAT